LTNVINNQTVILKVALACRTVKKVVVLKKYDSCWSRWLL